MSSRAIRKLHQGPELDFIANIGSSEEEIELTNNKKFQKNPFELLNENDDNGHSEEELVEDQQQQQHQQPKQLDQQLLQGARKKKRRQKSKAKKQEKKSHEERDDDVETSVREVNELLGPATYHHSAIEGRPDNMAESKSLLVVEHKHLNPDNEMKRKFGAQVVNSDANRRRNHSRAGVHRRAASWLTSPKDTWPHAGKTGISMVPLEKKGKYQYFTFEHSRDYQKVQFKFLDAVESLNPNNIVSLVNMHPYHIDSLLQLSEICKVGEDLQMAAELIERALYCFEKSFHTLFNMTQGLCRLGYRKQENRAYFLALFRHIEFVGKRGCYRTSLELCKLLLSLDPDNDPLCVQLMIDFYALRAQEYDYLVRMFSEWEAHRNLSQLPNFAFSVALAYFHTSNGDTSKADKMLQAALISFPSVLLDLLDKCGVQPDSKVETSSFFSAKAALSESPGLRSLVVLYTNRTHSVWKEAEVLLWLERNVHQVLSIVDSQDPSIKESAQRRERRYQGIPRNILRHILVTEIAPAVSEIPKEMREGSIMAYDPLPPLDNIVSYERPPRKQGTSSTEDINALQAFFQSLWPSYNTEQPQGNPGEQPAENNDDDLGAVGYDGHVQPGESARTNLRQSVGTLMNAMRDLLAIVRTDENDNQSEDEDDEDGNN